MSTAESTVESTTESTKGAPSSQQSEHGSFLDAYPDGVEHHYWSRARNRIVHQLLCQHGDAQAPVLEIGCARGVVTQYLRECGVDCWGVDLEESAPMNERVDRHLQTGVDFFDLDSGWVSRFGTLLLLDVLEHIEKPADFLSLVMDRAPSVRSVIVTMPARMELWSNYDEHYGHYLRYDKDSILSMAQEAGLRVRSWGYAFRPLLIAGWLTQRLGLGRSTTIQAPGPLMRPLHGVIAGMMSLECAALPASIPGSSIYAVLERPAFDRLSGDDNEMDTEREMDD